MKVELQKIIDALYEVNDDNGLYLDTEAGETVLIYDGGVYGGGDGVEDMTPDEVEESERFIFLPSPFDINNSLMMQDCRTDSTVQFTEAGLSEISGMLLMKKVLLMSGTSSVMHHIAISQQSGAKRTLSNG